MDNFIEQLTGAKNGDSICKNKITEMYRPLLIKWSIVDGLFDEDLYQELQELIITCIESFDF